MNAILKYSQQNGISFRFIADRSGVDYDRIIYLKNTCDNNWELFQKISLHEAKKLSFIPSIKHFIRQDEVK